ncbi:TetR/AcrR family transcriptional regulator [Noviherbaspirillum sedimenti]|uniref:TetR/AcrR family transcriptional regulator n=2 Tax=Noviherbaspirillum sedimenti TaxID=2320865 RepID=A0A3A3GL71_9BURK|nr:TetR/AcrR family transcriptional regulator [Noviherbaspirillum sedimenti]
MLAPIKSPRKREALGVRSERRVKEILMVARQVFSEQGYEKSTVLEIARSMDVSEATVFSYFTSKRDLCMQVIKVWYDEISSELEREVPLIIGTRAQLHFIVRKHLATLMHEGTGMCKLVLSEGRTVDEEFAEMQADLRRRYTAPLKKVFSTAQRSGEIRQDMPLPLLRDLVYGATEHVLWDYVVTNNKPDIDTTAAQLTDMFWSSLVPLPADLKKLAQFHVEVADALRRLDVPAEGNARIAANAR